MDLKAAFFGSSDPENSITVDKPPLSLWIMGISVRIFGFNPMAMLMPQVLMGVGTTLLIYLILRRYVSAAAALLASVTFFTTPIVTLLSRYNNPDPLMLLLMTAALWCTIRSIESGKAHLFGIAGALLGLAFMTKQLQGLISMPALGVAYLAFSPLQWLTRLRSAAVACLATAVTGGAWMAIVELTPASLRPYVGGSRTNSIVELTLGYNGVDRISGGDPLPEAMQVPAEFSNVDSDAGILRLLNANYNQEASWLLYVALGAVIVIACSRRQVKACKAYRALIVCSSIWLVTAFIVLSYMGSQIHTYYTAVLAPPIALILGIAIDRAMSPRRLSQTLIPWGGLALVGILTSWLILRGTVGWPDWLPTAILVAGVSSIAALILKPPTKVVEIGAATVLLIALVTGPTVTSIHNVTLSFTGSNPLSGVLSQNPAGISHLLESLKNNELPWGHDMVFGRQPDTEVVSALRESTGCRWSAASYASQTAARLQLESGRAVMPLGGFAGSDPSPTLDTFKKIVASGDVCFFVEQEAFLEVQALDSESTDISKWVSENYHPEKVGNTTVYRLVKP
ncbi:glycosyltransferase family 39 protein [Pseudarthrobacter sp. SL88]|uniref:ArnT family glycosyltransferase n=1 Tax=Pseudarthrobacter sp. SL88 TaxID=2994666 RepID=UPI002276580B|nr:glycosyltransferase family 39 protein [Pseudarthrobacter sp. SL88]MCY1674076.1 glycosyltransferase family 39 protein [Pseudarthrobacter sp. SL88]